MVKCLGDGLNTCLWYFDIAGCLAYHGQTNTAVSTIIKLSQSTGELTHGDFNYLKLVLDEDLTLTKFTSAEPQFIANLQECDFSDAYVAEFIKFFYNITHHPFASQSSTAQAALMQYATQARYDFTVGAFPSNTVFSLTTVDKLWLYCIKNYLATVT